MNTRRRFLAKALCLSAVAAGAALLPARLFGGPRTARAATGGSGAKTGERVPLPQADMNGGLPLMQALARRKSSRSFKADDLVDQELANLLWAAWGVNREDGRRTAPTARNQQEVEVYAAMSNGVWRYDGRTHELVKELERDTRSAFGGAPLTLAYAAKPGLYAGMHLGSLYQNVGLYCASAGLANVVKGTGVDVLKKDLQLPSGYVIMIVQSIGLPA